MSFLSSSSPSRRKLKGRERRGISKAERGMRVTVSFWGDENGLDLGNSDGCRTS